jgi:hypothetical protein
MYAILYMDELNSEQTYQLNKMIKRWKTDEMLPPHFGDIYLFKSLCGRKRAVYCDSKTFSVFKAHTQEEEYIDDAPYRKRRYRK